ncbi:MAG: HAD hydrolase family protein, partial [Dialister sp.]|nr:HAD family hydrolase [Dialister sp.]MDD7667071.1 HAD hydrolase family protein [Dialister sp.]MDY2621900.1 HAD hydrolase family protein [Dialister sp.]
MNLIKLIAIDLDDTLLHDDISLSEYTKDTLRKAMQKGVRIVIATGRMFQAA